MSRRSRKHRKRFQCRHRGFGQYCHRCTALRIKQHVKGAGSQADRSNKQVNRRIPAESALFELDPIDLRRLPQKVAQKARQLLAALKQGQNFFHLGGKQFHFDRSLLRFPVTYRYRLLCRRDASGITPLQVLSHEAYNSIARNHQQAG
jgi:hypothetical protein